MVTTDRGHHGGAGTGAAAKRVILILAALVGIFALAIPVTLVVHRWAMSPTYPRHTGDRVVTSTSPDGQWEVRCFEQPYGGGAGGVAEWVSVRHVGRGEPSRDIYYAEMPSDSFVKWPSNTTVDINGHLIDVRSGSYGILADPLFAWLFGAAAGALVVVSLLVILVTVTLVRRHRRRVAERAAPASVSA